MLLAEIKYYHLLLIFCKVKYDIENKRSVEDKFIVSSFASYIENQTKNFVKISKRASSDTIKNYFSRLRKGDYEDLKSESKVVPNTLAIFCGFSDLRNFKSEGPKIIDGHITPEYEKVYNQLIQENKIELYWCEKILESLRIGSNVGFADYRFGNFPENWLHPSFCLELEMETQGIITNVITSNLNWANYYKRNIINAIKNNNSYFQYLLTSTKGETNMYDLLDIAEEEGVLDRIKIVRINDRIMTNKFNFKVGDFIFQPVAGVVFPLPNDIVIYTNIPNTKAKGRFIFLDKWGRRSIAVIGTTPFSYSTDMDEITAYYDIAIEKSVAEEILSWFNYVWEIIKGEKPA